MIIRLDLCFVLLLSGHFKDRFYCIIKKTFCGFSMGSYQYWAGRVYDLCVNYMTGTPEGSTESGFMEKLGIEPATPGLQDIGLSPTPRHYLGSDTRNLSLGLLTRSAEFQPAQL